MKLSLALFLCVSLATAPDADPVVAVQEIIAQQIHAFRQDDPALAYALASPALREKFPREDAFLAMVKREYGPVYRAGSFAFGRTKIDGDAIVQEVLISGPDGKDWTALYQLVRQPDGDYRINGVHLVATAPGPGI